MAHLTGVFSSSAGNACKHTAAVPGRCMATVLLWVLAAVGCFGSCSVGSLLAAEPAALSTAPPAWIERFEDAWNPDAWTGRAFGKESFIRPMDDSAWKLRMQAMRSLVMARPASIKPLIEALERGTPAVRILAAQTLTYLAHDVPADVLWTAASTDSEAAVRLYAVDALGMRGLGPLRQRLEARQKVEPNGDVRKHIGYALARSQAGDAAGAAPIDLATQMERWDPTTIDTARLGEPAPDFTLSSLTGQKVSLGDFRGRQAVVLVFIYGDT